MGCGAGRKLFVIPSHSSAFKVRRQFRKSHSTISRCCWWQFAGVAMTFRLIGDPRRTLAELKIHASDVESPAEAANVHNLLLPVTIYKISSREKLFLEKLIDRKRKWLRAVKTENAHRLWMWISCAALFCSTSDENYVTWPLVKLPNCQSSLVRHK